MIHKSYILEQKIEKIDEGITLFYGENLGLINDFKELIRKFNNKSEIIRFNEEEIIKKNIIFFREISSDSLFNEKKVIFIDQASDKILDLIKEVEKIDVKKSIYLFSSILEKKSKLRAFFEKSEKYNIVPCYEDNKTTLKKIILQNLKDFQGITTENINLIIDNCSLNRTKLKNELDKIKSFFHDKILKTTKIEKLLNIKTNNDFDKLKDAALLGDRKDTNKLLSDTILETEKNIFYLNSINQRLGKLLEINNNNSNVEKAISDLRPPVFWKDKPNFISQAKVWNQKKINTIMKNTYDIEIKIKSNSSINKHVLIKKLLVDICELANAS
tara:strand:+ start:802 stop:1788 length:987 start_codon:yes stop_codon:yes gene_type:complete